jgi:hypothetical protein
MGAGLRSLRNGGCGRRIGGVDRPSGQTVGSPERRLGRARGVDVERPRPHPVARHRRTRRRCHPDHRRQGGPAGTRATAHSDPAADRRRRLDDRMDRRRTRACRPAAATEQPTRADRVELVRVGLGRVGLGRNGLGRRSAGTSRRERSDLRRRDDPRRAPHRHRRRPRSRDRPQRRHRRHGPRRRHDRADRVARRLATNHLPRPRVVRVTRTGRGRCRRRRREPRGHHHPRPRLDPRRVGAHRRRPPRAPLGTHERGRRRRHRHRADQRTRQHTPLARLTREPASGLRRPGAADRPVRRHGSCALGRCHMAHLPRTDRPR